MRISLPDENRIALRIRTKKFRQKSSCRISDFASLIVSLVSACRAVSYGMLYTRGLERQKFLACQKFQDDYSARMEISRDLGADFDWWIERLSSVLFNTWGKQGCD